MSDSDVKSNLKKFGYELADMLASAAFPLMLMIVLSVSIIQFVGSTEDLVIRISILVIGEGFLVAAYVIFGRQNGVVAYRKTVQQEKKRALGTQDLRVQWRTGEYALYKGVVIGLISCIPYMLFEIIECAAPNGFCEVVLSYGFGWAHFPFILGGLSGGFGLLLVIPLVAVHAVAYYLGMRRERQKQEAVSYSGGKRER